MINLIRCISADPAVIPTMLPTFAPSVAPTKTLSPTVTRAPTTPLPPTTKWPTVALPGQGGGYVGLAMNTGGTFFVAIPLMGEPVFVTANANGGYKIVEGYYPYTGPWQTVAMSNDGNRVIYVGGYTLMFSISMQPNIEYGWENIFYTAAISGDGSTVVAASYSYTEYYPVSIYINQPGQPFVPQMTILKNIVTYPTGANLVGIALNYDGHTITLLLTNRDIYLSKNQGASFTILNALCSTTMTPSMTYFMSAYNNGSNLVVASTTNNTMLYSMNQGQSWQQSNTSNLIHPTTMFSSVAGSDSGQFMIMASNNAIYTSANFGQNWTYANPLWGNITSNAIGLGIVASDSIGSHVAFVETNSNLLYIQMIANIPTLAPSASPTFRPSATPTISPTPSPTTTAPSTSMAPSVTPTTSQPSISPTPFPTTTKPSVTPTVQIQQDNFLQYDAGNSFFYMTMDATGTIGATTSFYQVYVSLNSGLTWALVTQPLANGNWRNLVLSGNGEYLYVYNFASPTLLYRASNASSFNQWTTIGNQLMTYANSLDTDYTGKYVAACGGSGIQLSSNYGVDFAYLPAIPGIFPGTVYYAVSMDNTGAYFTVADGAGNVYYTTNYGQSFNTSQAFVDNAGQFIEALITSAGNANQYQYAFTSASLCVAGQSVNGGKLWQSIVIDPNAVAVTNYIYAAISANGQFVAFIYNQYVYYSSDYGKSFEIIYTYYSSNGGTLNGIAINSAGSIIFLASTNGIFSYRANTPNTLPPSFSPTFAPTTQNTVINFPIATAGYGYVAVSSNAEYITAVPPYQVYGGAATFYTANTGQIVQVGNFMDSSQVCMSDDARYQILMLDYLAYYVVDYNFQGLTTAKLNTTLTYINSLNWCAMTSSGNVSIIGTQNTSPQLLFIYVQNGNFQPYFYPVKSYPSTTGTSVTGIEIDNTGQIIAAILTTGEMHLSTNQGKTWTTIPALRSHIPLNVVSFTMSLTANSLNQQDMIAVSTNSQFLNGAVSYSNNTGSTWQSNTQGVSSTTYPWSNIDSSATGQYAAVVGDGIVYLSKDFGHSWSHVYAMPNLNTAKVSIDPTGHYTAISQYSSNQIILLQTMNVPTFAPTYSMAPTTLRPTYPITSTPSNPPVFPPTAAPTMQQKLLPFTMVTMPSYGSCCNAIATSANGSAGLGYFYASPTLYIFTRYGFSWTTVPGFNPPALFSAVAVSGDGHLFLAAAGAVLYSSTNPTAAGGWVAFPSSSTLLTSTIIDIAVSTNGNYIVLVTGSAPYAVLSSNGGQSFTVLTGVSTAGNNGGMSSVTMDSTGLFIALATAYGYVYVSTNGGNSFTSNQVLYATIINSVAIAGSSAKKNQNLYVSSVTTSLSSTATTSTIMSNNQQGLSTAWVSDEVDPAGIVPTGIAVTSNGKTVVLVTKYQVFMNNNFGNANDWYVILNGADLCSIAIDANGTNIYIGAQYFVYMYHNGKSKFVPFFRLG